MNIFYNVFASLIIPTIIVLVLLFILFKENKLQYTEDYFAFFQLLLSIFPVTTFASYYTINAIFDINQTNEMVIHLFFLMGSLIFMYSLYLYFCWKSSYVEHIYNYFNISSKSIEINSSIKDKIFLELKKTINKSAVNKYENDLFISINQFSLLIRSNVSFYDYLRAHKFRKKQFSNKLEVLIGNPISNMNNTRTFFSLEKILNTFELGSIDEIQDEHFKVFEMLNI